MENKNKELKKTLVLYVFHEKNERVTQFFQNALFLSERVNFLIICNNPSINKEELKQEVYGKANIVDILVRENKGYDFGGWSDGLSLVFGKEIEKYTYFIFVNSSVIGPFLPDGTPLESWPDIYISKLNGEHNVKIVGSTINTEGGNTKVISNNQLRKSILIRNPMLDAHVQSYIFCVDIESLFYFIEEGIFDTKQYITEFGNAINKEVLMSRKMIEKGWNIGCLFHHYVGVDFTFKTQHPDVYKKRWLGDIMVPHFYENIYWKREDIVFIKGNRV
jgi:hypothetical protein